MPPVKALEDYLDLVSAVEATSRALGMRVLLEGLSAAVRSAAAAFPRHPGSRRDRGERAAGRATGISSSSRRRRSTRTRGTSGLSPEKFMLDGRHTGTGGGNHFVLGGSSPADSPFLRRPDLLRSLITYWHNHPSLSYLFSGLFLGPTSQAPRIDEGAARQPLRDRDRVLALRAAGRADAALVRRSRAAPPAGGRHRQHAPRRVLHRQALLAGSLVGPARPARAAGLRDAARRPHERRAAAAAPRLDRALLARAVRRRPDALGHGAARSVHAPVFHRARLRRRDRGAAAGRLRRCRPSGSRRTSSSGFRWPASCRHARFT